MISFKQFILFEDYTPRLIPTVAHDGIYHKSPTKGVTYLSHNHIRALNKIPEGEGKEGYIDHRGKFLDREKALGYAKDHNMLNDHGKAQTHATELDSWSIDKK